MFYVIGSSKYIPEVPVNIPSNDIVLSERVFIVDGMIKDVVNNHPSIALFDTDGKVCLELILDTTEGRLKATSERTVNSLINCCIVVQVDLVLFLIAVQY